MSACADVPARSVTVCPVTVAPSWVSHVTTMDEYFAARAATEVSMARTRVFVSSMTVLAVSCVVFVAQAGISTLAIV